MYQIFLAIISLLATVYCFWTKQVKMAFGFLILTVAFFLLNPQLTMGIQTDIAGASAMVLFIAGSFLIVWKKRPKIEEKKTEENTNA
jgi:thiol:disulfide interchange protein